MRLIASLSVDVLQCHSSVLLLMQTESTSRHYKTEI